MKQESHNTFVDVLRKIFQGLLTMFIVIMAILVLMVIYNFIEIKIKKKDYANYFGYTYMNIISGSMADAINVDDYVFIKLNAKDLKEGDVITFASSDTRFAGTIITHRIIKKNYNSKTKSYTFQTKGDNNNVADSALVSPNDIFGKVILKIPKLGYLRDFLASDGGWILVVLFPCLAVVAYDIVKIGKGLKRKKYKNIIVQSR
jgi:signal peptidase I